MAIPTPTPIAILPIATPSAAPMPAPIAIPAPTLFTLTGSFGSVSAERPTYSSTAASGAYRMLAEGECRPSAATKAQKARHPIPSEATNREISVISDPTPSVIMHSLPLQIRALDEFVRIVAPGNCHLLNHIEVELALVNRPSFWIGRYVSTMSHA